MDDTSNKKNTGWSHVDEEGQPTMVDVSKKEITKRNAKARCVVKLPPEVLAELQAGDIQTAKGSVVQTAIIAGTQAAKQTSSLIPFCHAIPLDSCKIRIAMGEGDTMSIESTVSATHKTGVEMEALTAVSVAALTVYDMCKAFSHEVRIGDIQLIEKTGGKSDYQSDE